MSDSNMFMVTPTNFRLDLEPGQVYTGGITISNPIDATSDFPYQVSATPYSVTDSEYDADFSTISSYSSIINWITFPEPKGTLAPNETRNVPFIISVPENVRAGGQYLSIMVSMDENTKKESGVGIYNIYEIACIVYANVKGETVHSGEIIDTHIDGFILNLPAKTSVMLRNDGNIHESVRIYLKVTNAITGELVYPSEDISGGTEEIIMPETSRLAIREIEGISPLGIYKVEQTIDYLGTSKIHEQTLIACPLWFLILGIVTISAILATIIRAIIKYKRKKVTIQ